MNIPFPNYLNIRQSYGPSYSYDNQRIAFLSNITGIPQVWEINAQGGWPDQLTFSNERVESVYHSPVNSRLLFSRDAGGNENAQIFLIEGDGSSERRLTDDDGAIHLPGGWLPDGQHITFSANRRNRSYFDLYIQDIDQEEAKLVWQNDQLGYLIPAAVSPRGDRVLVFMLHHSMNSDLYEVELASGAVRYLTPHAGDVRYGSPCYSADGRSVFCVCDLGRDFTAPTRLDLDDLSLHTMAELPAEVDFVAASPDGRWLVWITNEEGAHRPTLHNLKTGENQQPADFPLGVINPLDDNPPVFSRDSRTLAFAFTTPVRTLDVWSWDLERGAIAAVTRSSHAGIPRESFVPPELVHYPSFDGLEVPAWFYPPRRNRGDSFPVLVYVHGGPEGQTQPMLFPILQYLIHQEYGVFAPNVRGSSGYGKRYLALDNVEKRMDSVADLAYAVYWLREQPGVDPDSIAVYGGSYGGFMVLSALTTYPDLWAAGVDIVGISNFVTFLENTGAYRRSHREGEYGSLARDREFLTRISPIHQVDRITAPLMVIHGANDPRVPLGEAEQIVAALQARGVPVKFLVYPDEGHGIVRLHNKLDAYPQVAEFLKQHV